MIKGMEKLKKDLQTVNKKVKGIEKHNRVIKKRTEGLGDQQVIQTGNAMAGLLGIGGGSNPSGGNKLLSGKPAPKRGGLGGLLGKN